MLDQGMDVNLSSIHDDVCEHTLQWLDLSSHLRMRETCLFYSKRVPSLATTLTIGNCRSARRCLETVFRNSHIRVITADLSCQPSSSLRRRMYDELVESHIDDPTLAPLIMHYRPREFRVTSMVSGVHFSDALHALEVNLTSAREHLRVVQLELVTGGPRPYQDALAHQECMGRLVRVLVKDAVGEQAGAAVGAGGGSSVLWRHLEKLRLSCGVVDGDLEGIAGSLASMPALEVLVLEGHPFRAPRTTLITLAAALLSVSEIVPHRPHLRTLELRHFNVEGVEGLSALGGALSAERFPHLSSVAFDSCRLNDEQVSALASTVPGMSRGLRSLSLNGNYALSADGVLVLVCALQSAASAGRGHGGDLVSTLTNAGSITGKATSTSTPAESTPSHLVRAPAWSVASPVIPSCPPSLVMLEVLDLSYSCWWRRPVSKASSVVPSIDPIGKKVLSAGKAAIAPLTHLLKALGDKGFLPHLKTLNLCGCYFGNEETEDLAVALESGCRSMRLVDVTGNLFSEVGVARLLKALLSGKMPPQLRIRVCNGRTPFGKELYAAMDPCVILEAADAWIDYQTGVLGTTVL